jgi:quinol-cytochrome oxidoreductase complex cytochrome b subunit
MTGARQSLREWLSQFWADLKASTDAGLLAVPRFLGLLYGPIDTRLPIDQAFRKALGYRLPPHVGWRHALGGVAYLFFILLVVTGVLLAVHYRPSVSEAYPSVQHIVSGVTLGWLMRDLHVWAANLVVIAALVHMARVFIDAAHKPPRETTWLAGILLLLVVLLFGATGYLLPWDQWAYWAVTDALAIVDRVPLIGGALTSLMRGDPIVSGATLSRFFAVHVIVLPWMAFALLMFHFAVIRRHGIAEPKYGAVPAGPGRRFFPNHLLRSLIVAVLVCAAVITAAAMWPRPLGDPADPARMPDAMRSTWIAVDVSRALAHYVGPWGFTAFSLLGLGLALMPLFDRGPERQLRRRPVVAALGALFFIGFLAAWVAGRQLHSASPASTVGPAIPAAVTPAETLPPAPATDTVPARDSVR